MHPPPSLAAVPSTLKRKRAHPPPGESPPVVKVGPDGTHLSLTHTPRHSAYELTIRIDGAPSPTPRKRRCSLHSVAVCPAPTQHHMTPSNIGRRAGGSSAATPRSTAPRTPIDAVPRMTHITLRETRYPPPRARRDRDTTRQPDTAGTAPLPRSRIIAATAYLPAEAMAVALSPTSPAPPSGHPPPPPSASTVYVYGLLVRVEREYSAGTGKLWKERVTLGLRNADFRGGTQTVEAEPATAAPADSDGERGSGQERIAANCVVF
ncbi:hypothetical protein MIND_01334300 [Mycena indigotica]|uniref:Uncharacterized protein n=1 Tax=Mycena indigotica TaxID=2126181 RepID=A0A8H6VU57_9AGAR|nr:uncharacterized protein MIND_01334300 [Mycena indigotica]KAF7290208.1 hypothetical protein MIND_01334300 [Mycena indigotica]